MFSFFKKPICTQCMNCGVDFSNHKKFTLSFFDGLIRRLDLDPVGWDGKDPNTECRLVAICVLCYADYFAVNPDDEFYPDKEMVSLCQRLHDEQHIIIPNGLPRDDGGRIIDNYEARPKFKFITDTSISLQNHKNIKINKESYSYLRSPEVIRIRTPYINTYKMKLNKEKLIKAEEELKKLGSGVHDVTLPSGAKYKGELKDGKPHGQGTSSYTISSIGTGTYTGEFKNGKPHGKGTFFLPTEIASQLGVSKWEGDWEDGYFQGDVLTGK